MYPAGSYPPYSPPPVDPMAMGKRCASLRLQNTRASRSARAIQTETPHLEVLNQCVCRVAVTRYGRQIKP
jgi:hypothetical protein